MMPPFGAHFGHRNHDYCTTTTVRAAKKRVELFGLGGVDVAAGLHLGVGTSWVLLQFFVQAVCNKIDNGNFAWVSFYGNFYGKLLRQRHK